MDISDSAGRLGVAKAQVIAFFTDIMSDPHGRRDDRQPSACAAAGVTLFNAYND